MHPLDALDDLDAYRRLFTDVALWTPYVQEVCRKHGLSPRAPVRLGVPGTCPVFIAGDDSGEARWVVKFFGRLFDGARSFAAEREAARLVKRDPRIHTAQVLASGELGAPGWPWPYLVFEFVHGSSIGAVFEQVTFADRLRGAAELGDTLRRMHALPLDDSPVFPNSHAPYLDFLQEQRPAAAARAKAWGSLPARLVEQIEGFLPPIDTLVDRTRPAHLIHADLTRDHLMGDFSGGHWRSTALIDFGDARTGDLLYELCALHLDCFGSDRRLLHAFLDAYGLGEDQRAELPRKALATALLHEFNVFAAVPADLLHAASLDELAEALWGLP